MNGVESNHLGYFPSTEIGTRVICSCPGLTIRATIVDRPSSCDMLFGFKTTLRMHVSATGCG